MRTYLVGGAVRDELLGDPVRDRDWVVVGTSAEALTAKGFRPVGREFPVFLHPQSHEEYALARTERKTAKGYHGFQFDTSANVTLEEDLVRRDLTINAIAKDSDGNIIDPHGGQQDLKAGIIRHVSSAFGEDPVRILRVARFAARYAHRGFRIAAETMQLMRNMVSAGEVDALVAERVWLDLEKALAEPTPSAFVTTLRDSGALAVILPEVAALFGVPQRAKYHPEIDTGIHLLMVLDQAARMRASPPVVFACLLHDVGKGITPSAQLPSHHGHETTGVPLVKAVCRRLNAPKEFQHLAEQVCRYHIECHRALELRPKTILRLIEKVNGLRQPAQLERVLLACEADKRGRLGLSEATYPQADFLRRARAAAVTVDPRPFIEQGLDKAALGDAIRRTRIQAIAQLDRSS